MTQKQKIEMFDKIVQRVLEGGSDRMIGEAIRDMIETERAKKDWLVSKITKEDQEVIDAYSFGWQFYSVDGVTWYDEYNKKSSGPFLLTREPQCKVVSSRMINKLLRLNLIGKDYLNR